MATIAVNPDAEFPLDIHKQSQPHVMSDHHDKPPIDEARISGSSMPHGSEPQPRGQPRPRWQLQLRTMFLLTAAVAALCWLTINMRWLGSQLSLVRTSTTVLESNSPHQPGGIVMLTPRRIASRGFHPLLPGNLRWIAIWSSIALGGALWWRTWRQTHATAITVETPAASGSPSTIPSGNRPTANHAPPETPP
ncbi:MAG: hypothetical protein CMJ75_10030 [Planctomycetaceae bacterium]|nr:hypothetical protein [Planctomycetaceae bacterium]